MLSDLLRPMKGSSILGADVGYWKRVAQKDLPPEEKELERNAAITARYARWYLEKRDLLKWAGMAAFASHQVGIALAIDQATGGVFPDLDVVRETNNLVYDDIGWTHLAYDAGRSRAVEEALTGAEPRVRAGYSMLLDGFRLIDDGRNRIADGWKRLGQNLVWKGSLLLLKHEQFHTVQPQFGKLSRNFTWLFSLATSMEFHPDHHEVKWQDVSWFTWYMWTVGILVLVTTLSPPDIVLREHRWFWIRTRLFPLWQTLKASDRWLDEELEKLAHPLGPQISAPIDTPGTRPSRDRDVPPLPPPSR